MHSSSRARKAATCLLHQAVCCFSKPLEALRIFGNGPATDGSSDFSRSHWNNDLKGTVVHITNVYPAGKNFRQQTSAGYSRQGFWWACSPFATSKTTNHHRGFYVNSVIAYPWLTSLCGCFWLVCLSPGTRLCDCLRCGQRRQRNTTSYPERSTE